MSSSLSGPFRLGIPWDVLSRAHAKVDVRNGVYRWLTVQRRDQPSFQLVVEFTQEPVTRFGSVDAGFRDPSGNGWKMIEARR